MMKNMKEMISFKDKKNQWDQERKNKTWLQSMKRDKLSLFLHLKKEN